MNGELGHLITLLVLRDEEDREAWEAVFAPLYEKRLYLQAALIEDLLERLERLEEQRRGCKCQPSGS